MALQLATFLDGAGEYEVCSPQLLQEADLAVLKVTAQWCGPCKQIHPHFLAACRGVPGLRVCVLDVDAAQRLELLGVEALPTFIAFREGVEQQRVKGADLLQIQDMIARLGTHARQNTAEGKV